MTGPWPLPGPSHRLENTHVALTPVNPNGDWTLLYAAASVEANQDDLFRYHVNIAPMTDRATFDAYMTAKLALKSEVMYQVFSKRLGKPVGCASLMNLRPQHGVVEVGSIWYSREAQKTEINTNAMFLLFGYVFEELGYRRLEWKCNNRNDDSKRAAVRLGFVYEGLFRQHFVSRGENRDTAWYAMLDSEWPEQKRALQEKAALKKPAP